MKRKFKIKHKIPFTAMCILWLASIIGFGISLQNPLLTCISTCICSTIAIWQTNLNDEKTTEAVLVFFLINLFLGNTVKIVPLLQAGDLSSAIILLMTVLIFMGIIIGLPILFIYIRTKKGNSSDAFIQNQFYPEELWKKKQEQSFGMAKRMSVLTHLMGIVLAQLLLSLVLWLVTSLGIDACSYFFHLQYRSGNYFLTRGIFIPIMLFFLISLCIVPLWFAIVYKRLEVRCLHLGYELKGAVELNTAAAKANLHNQMAKAVDIPCADFGKVHKQGQNIADAYLLVHEKKPANPLVFKRLNTILTILQIMIAVGVYIYCFA